MSNDAQTRSPVRKWISRGFFAWAIFSTCWMANSFRTQGVPPATLASSGSVKVWESGERLEFRPATPRATGLIFLCGSGVAAQAYAPLLRPIAEAGTKVCIVKLPWRFAPLASHQEEAVVAVRELMAGDAQISRWIVAGHSLGAALACRVAASRQRAPAGLVLLGTTHPKQSDLSGLALPVTKVLGSNDGVAPLFKAEANRRLLPGHTRWVVLNGGNHSQFGHYGHQLLDGRAGLSRAEQQELARRELLRALTAAEENS